MPPPEQKGGERPTPVQLDEPALLDTGVWSWARDRRFPALADWFNEQVAAGMVICDLIVIELTRAAPSPAAAASLGDRLSAFGSNAMPGELWTRARELQLALARRGEHRRVPPADLLIAAAAERSGVQLLHYDSDYPLLAAHGDLRQRWFVGEGSLAPQQG